MTVFQNIYQFSRMVPETAHDGHHVELTSKVYQPDPGEEELRMVKVKCLVDQEEFEAFAEEVGL